MEARLWRRHTQQTARRRHTWRRHTWGRDRRWRTHHVWWRSKRHWKQRWNIWSSIVRRFLKFRRDRRLVENCTIKESLHMKLFESSPRYERTSTPLLPVLAKLLKVFWLPPRELDLESIDNMIVDVSQCLLRIVTSLHGNKSTSSHLNHVNVSYISVLRKYLIQHIWMGSTWYATNPDRCACNC